jgi:D-alanyl-D-alanine carboxypeptidase
MRKYLTIVFCFLSAFVFCSALLSAANKKQTATPDTAALKRISESARTRLEQFRAKEGFPGANFAFVLPDGAAASVSVGVSDIVSQRSLMSTDLMLAASVGKTFVAATMLQLAQEGKVNLDDKIERWFKDDAWFKRLPNATSVTVRMLLNHSSGIPNQDFTNLGKAVLANPDRSWKPEELIAFILDKTPLFAAGEDHAYADTNYLMVGMIIERITNQTLYHEVTRRFLKPLNLTHTIPQEGRVIPGVINGYTSDAAIEFGIAGPKGAMIVDGKFVFNPQFEWAGGGFASTAEDLAHWAKALYEGQLIKQPYFDQMLTGIKAGIFARYGLGVNIGEGRWGKSYGHDGGFPGYRAAIKYFPRYRVAVALMFNTDRQDQLKREPGEYLNDLMRIIVSDLSGKIIDEPKEPKQIAVDPKLYDAFVGQYQISPKVIITIKKDENRLFAQGAEIFPASETEYFFKVVDAQISFRRNDKGEVTGLVVTQAGNTLAAPKIK